MAETTDTDEFNIQAIAQHLQKGPFAPIFDQSSEKDDHVALKFMCIVDYKTQRWDLYNRIKDNPKLLGQLMQFRSYGRFKYYDYQAGHEMGKRVLKCKFCELIGPYGCILSHMAINHNTHIGVKVCNYCNRIDLRKHYDDNSLQQCYGNYLQQHDIQWNECVCLIVSDFYAMLKTLSQKFKINTVRNHVFAALGFSSVERLDRGYDSDIDETVKVFKNRTPQMTSKNISGRLDEVDKEFKRVISVMYGGNNASRLWQQAADGNSIGGIETIVVSDSEEEDDGGSRGTSSNRPAATAADNQPQDVTIANADTLANDLMTFLIMPNREPTANDFPIISNPSTSTTVTSNANVPIEEQNNDFDLLEHYQRAIMFFGCKATRLIQQSINANGNGDSNTITISDDDGEDDGSSRATSSIQASVAAAANDVINNRSACSSFETANASGEGTSSATAANADENVPTTSQIPIKPEPAADDCQTPRNVGSHTSMETLQIRNVESTTLQFRFKTKLSTVPSFGLL